MQIINITGTIEELGNHLQHINATFSLLPHFIKGLPSIYLENVQR